MKKIIPVFVALALSACSTYTPQRYSVAADNHVALKTIAVGNINVGAFKGLAGFDNNCRAAG